MAQLTSDQYRTNRGNVPDAVSYKVAADAVLYPGAIVGILTAGTNAGYAVPVNPAVSTVVQVVGICLGLPYPSNGVANNTGGANGALSVMVQGGQWLIPTESGSVITQAHVGRVCRAGSDNTVAISGTNNHAVGRVVEVTADGIWVDVGRTDGVAVS